MIRNLCTFAALAIFALLSPAEEAPRESLLVVVGAGGNENYGTQFQQWAAEWNKMATEGGIPLQILGGSGGTGASREDLQKALESQPKTGSEPLWLVLLGHGTWDGSAAKFNLQGDDVSATEVAGWLKLMERPVVVIAAFSTSGAWMSPLADPNRIVLTATRSGSEVNFSRLGQHLPARFNDPESDRDKDGQVSLLEAWLGAAQKTAEFYTGEGRLATEHSLLDDNGDGRGTPNEWFQGVRAVKRAKDNAAPDGLRAHQIHLLKNPEEKAIPAPLRAERDTLELELAKLRDAKSTMDENAYYKKLEELLLKLAKLYGS